jgi:CheY-like chemotaxis protein
MDKKTQDHIFEAFFTTKEVGKGTGLGLLMVYGIAKNSGGFITVHSEPGFGTEFRIYLPAAREAPSPAVVTEPAVELRGEETILLAEDEPALQRKIFSILVDAGYRVLTGNDADEVIQVAAGYRNPPDLLLTDVVMPVMSGPQLSSHLQSLYPRMKVLFMSGYPSPRQGAAILPPDAEFLQKPFTRQKVLRRLREVLDNRTGSPSDANQVGDADPTACSRP